MPKKIIKVDNKELEAYLKEIKMPNSFPKGAIVEGTVVLVREDEVFVDIGGRSEGIITGRELRFEGKRVSKNVGDKIIAYVVKSENEEGQTVLSVRRTGMALRWYELEQIKEKEETIDVKVIEANTGGILVEIYEAIRGFVPMSQLKNNRIFSSISYSNKEEANKAVQTKLAEMIGETLKVKIMEIDKEKNKVILSEKSVYSETDLQLRNETLSALKVGDILEGVITGIAPFGLFVNAKGLEGLVHLSEISWDKVISPSDFYTVGDKVKVQVIGLQDKGKRVAYSIKRLLKDPWKDLVQKYKVGEVVEGEVKSVAQYGIFVKIEDGLNGLIHISELSNKLVKDPSQIVTPGQKIKVMIISISHEDRHLGLSLKRVAKKETKKDEASTSDLRELDKILNQVEQS